MEEEEDDKRIDLKRHQSYHYISPKFIIRFVLIIGAVIYLFYQLISIMEEKQTHQNEEKSIEKDSTTIEVELAPN